MLCQTGRSGGLVESSKAVQRHPGPVRSATSSAAAAALVVSEPDVEDEVSGELDRLAEVQEDNGGSIYVELRVAERLRADDQADGLNDDRRKQCKIRHPTPPRDYPDNSLAV